MDTGGEFVQGLGAEVGQFPRRQVCPHGLHRMVLIAILAYAAALVNSLYA
jgi:hypothetical protein